MEEKKEHTLINDGAANAHAKEDLEKLKDNTLHKEKSEYILGVPDEESRKRIEAIYKFMRLDEEYIKEMEIDKETESRLQEYSSDNVDKVIEMYREQRGKK